MKWKEWLYYLYKTGVGFFFQFLVDFWDILHFLNVLNNIDIKFLVPNFFMAVIWSQRRISTAARVFLALSSAPTFKM